MLGQASRLLGVLVVHVFTAEGVLLHVNCTGMGFEQALQAAVAQGLINRDWGAGHHIWLSDLAEGLGAGGQQDGAGFPGMKFIEWKIGHGGGPWYEPLTTCRTCGGLRERWLSTVAAAVGEVPVPTTFMQLMELAEPKLTGRSIYSLNEKHALGPLLTLAGTDGVLPTTAQYNTLPKLPVRLNSTGMFADATNATRYTTTHLLHKTNSSVLAVQAPTCLPYLADAIVDSRMAVFWMDDMCNTATQSGAAQHEAMEDLIERSGHYNKSQGVYYMGWYNHTREPNPELLEECTTLHRLITLASDQSENLSFLNKLGVVQPGNPVVPNPKLLQPPMWPRAGGKPHTYDPSKAYVTVIISDGDNIAEDWATLRPMLEERVNNSTKTPVAWTISNRWMQWGVPVLEWAFAQGRATGLDSFLMGPSGYGYEFPGNQTLENDKQWFVNATIGAAEALSMHAYIHWDVDLFLDPATTNRTVDLIKRYEGSVIRGVFQLASDPLGNKTESPTFVGNIPVFKPIYQYGPANATAAAAAINNVLPGSMNYIYLSLGYDMALVDEIAARTASHVELVGYREIIELARHKHTAEKKSGGNHAPRDVSLFS